MSVKITINTPDGEVTVEVPEAAELAALDTRVQALETSAPSPIDCELSAWSPEEMFDASEWTPCANNSQSRVEKYRKVRTVLTEPQNGGAVCGPLVEEREEIVTRECEIVQPSPGPHEYFEQFSARSDCFASYSLRDDAQVLQHSTYKGPRDLAYVYPDDPDPRKQDAMRMLTRADQSSPQEGLRLPIGAHHPKNLLSVEERWWGNEMRYEHARIGAYKGDPYFGSGGDGAWLAMRTQPKTATQQPQNLPPGGPYVLMLNPQSGNGSQVKPPFWRDNETGFPRLRLPYNVPSAETRGYVEGIAPRDTSVTPAGAEFGVKAETWTRIWWFFERAPEFDWSSTLNPAGPRTAYLVSCWAADKDRDPIRLIHEAPIAIWPGSTGFGPWYMNMGVGNADAAIPEGRGPMLAYARNVAFLHGVSREDALSLLKKPEAA